MIGLLRKHRFFRSHDAAGELRRRRDRRRRARHGHRLLPGQGPRHEERRRDRAELHRRRRVGPQHDHHPLELPDARGRPLLHGEREALRDAVAGPELQHAVLAARPPDAGPLRPVGEHDDGAGRGEPAARASTRGSSTRTRSRSSSRCSTPPTTPRSRSWPRSTTRRAASSATTRWCGATPRRPTGSASRSTPTPQVTGITRSNGRVTGIETNRGPIAAGTVISCTSGWSSLVGRLAGIEVPITTHILQACVTEPVKPLLRKIIVSGTLHIYISQSDRGEFVMGSEIEPYSGYSNQGTFRFIEDLAMHMVELLPMLGHARILRQWTGLCDVSPDYSPIMGLTETDGFLIDAGWGTYGFKASPIVGKTMAELGRDRAHARPDRAVPAVPLLRERDRVRARRRRRLPLEHHNHAPKEPALKSSLEIAQEATLRPIMDIAREIGLEEDEVDLYGKYKAKVSLGALDRLAGRARREGRVRLGHHPDQGRRGQDDHVGLAHAGPRPHRQAAGAVPARAVARADLRHQGRRRRRRAHPGRADGGPEPALHRRLPRHRRREQHAGRVRRPAPVLRQRVPTSTPTG